MKKIISIILVLISSIFISNVYAEELIVIEDVSCNGVYKGKDATDINVEIEDNNISINNIKFKYIDDYYECTINIKNNTKEEIEIENIDYTKNNEEYLEYIFNYNEDEYLGVDETREYKLRVTYKNEVEENIRVDNSFKIIFNTKETTTTTTTTETTTTTKRLSENTSNPKTGIQDYLLPFIIFLIIVFIIILIYIRRKKKKETYKEISIIVVLCLIAIDTVYAISVFNVEVKSTIIIETLPTWELIEDNDSDGVADIGDLICYDIDCFYVISNDLDNVRALAQYNLYVGGSYDGNTSYKVTSYGSNATNLQDSRMIGYNSIGYTSSVESYPYEGVTTESDALTYTSKYLTLLNEMKADVEEATLITKDELIELGCSEENHTCKNNQYSFVYSTSYWTKTTTTNNNKTYAWFVNYGGTFYDLNYDDDHNHGVRPVIKIKNSQINIKES